LDIKRVEVFGDHANLSTREKILNRKFLFRKSIFCAQICETPCFLILIVLPVQDIVGSSTNLFHTPKLSSMGIVLKRDNAPITKVVYGGVLDEILLNKNVQAAASFVRSSLMKLVDGDVPIEQLIISKTLRGSYVNPDSIVHAALETHARTRPLLSPDQRPRPVRLRRHGQPQSSSGRSCEDPKFIQENKLP
jgi:hypothetical protein